MIRILFCLSLCFSLILSSQFSFADAEADINYRKAVMKVVGGHMGGLSAILRGGVHGDELVFHAKGMANVSAIVPGVFPAGSGDGKTDALPVIWEDEADFKVAMDQFVSAAAEIGKAADTGDNGVIAGKMKALGDSCKNCHDNYKAD